MEGNEEDEEEESNHMPHIYVLKKHARKATRSQHLGTMADVVIKQLFH
jgi:hypothetical protein